MTALQEYGGRSAGSEAEGEKKEGWEYLEAMSGKLRIWEHYASNLPALLFWISICFLHVYSGLFIIYS